jgi:hypothetical protein
VEHDSDSIVCIISYEKVMGYYTLADKIDQFAKIGRKFEEDKEFKKEDKQ